MKKIFITAILVIIMAFAFSDAYAQYVVRIEGYVTKNENPVESAIITITIPFSNQTTKTATAVTYSNGYYYISINIDVNGPCMVGDATMTATKTPDHASVTFPVNILSLHSIYRQNFVFGDSIIDDI